MLGSFVFPLIIFVMRPFGMDWYQSAVIAVLLLVIIWWSTSLVNKIVSSCVLLLSFLLFTSAPLTTVFSFPLSNNFLLIAFTYVFSKGIANSGLAEKFLQPILFRYANTPVKSLLAIVVLFVITMYMIPQPLARLIIVADIFIGYLDKTTAPKDTKTVLMFGVFVLYGAVNTCTQKADIILNTMAVNVAHLSLTDGDWLSYMLVPSIVYSAIILGLMCLLFRKDLKGIRLDVCEEWKGKRNPGKVGKKEWLSLLLILGTVVLWMTEPIHGVASWKITLISIIIMFATGMLKLPDLKAVDISMLVFLTAALAIGGVMKANGTADIIFSRLGNILPNESVFGYIIVMIFITMCIHMILGSNTTTISVVIPGLLIMCRGILPSPIIMFISYLSSCSHWLLPFHAVGMMVGASKGYFPTKYMLKMGIPMTAVIVFAIICIYLPWWYLLGYL